MQFSIFMTEIYKVLLWTKVKNTSQMYVETSKLTIFSMKNVIEAMEKNEKLCNEIIFSICFDISQCFSSKIQMPFSTFPDYKKDCFCFFLFVQSFFSKSHGRGEWHTCLNYE